MRAETINGYGGGNLPILYDHEFDRFRDLIYRIAGISMSPAKKTLVANRLMKRLRYYGMSSFAEYYRLLSDPKQKKELQMAVDLLTTNETHFFREPKHFDFLSQHILSSWSDRALFRVWSAACSSGEEPYTLAMLLSEAFGDTNWEVIASDLSMRMLSAARKGVYSLDKANEIPKYYLNRYCLKGYGSKTGTLLMEKKLRDRVRFCQYNLTKCGEQFGVFDVIFLRNVLIYFDQETKRQVVLHLLPSLRSGGYFFVSHSETLNDIECGLTLVAPSIYRKPV
ncbi:CheR family methyltransferase [Methylotuvimicrobium buryatense]|uniref:Chemotaxis protein methyltransferase n=1 Tax=Methylotuvimicrobium buryatense TaxID=95641 RepID=A0A4P9UQS1_METBY|nr:protein-glutamate O-methyltransferase CheR [Methylotuvimicrobium buryatense]QCW82631.1 protein-glutamate O-methyltransferase CheR [Methylotuvimicrobium buryatense]